MNMNASPQQIQAAAAAGVELLSDKDLKVPLGVAMGGHLSVLQGLLAALMKGELILVNPPSAENKLEGIDGGKQADEGGDS
jgi:hypothetical protein